jgi:pyridinium-3,5-biscarboxylic acid mononucleotide sulfurtransferase
VSGAVASALPEKKFSEMVTMLRRTGEAVLAFSGGVDSTFLLRAMKTSGMRTIAVTAFSGTMPQRELERAVAFAEEAGVEHIVIRSDELSNEAFVSNPPDRCFFCKDELFRRLRAIADERHIGTILDGSNADDLRDYRPGRKAAELHGVISPLAECNFTKEEIRAMSRKLGLPTWDQPSSPCLSSRFPYGGRITPEALRRVERAEEYLRGLGLRDVRVRNHDALARIEVRQEDMHILLDPSNRRRIAEELRSLGYAFVSLDLEGYRTGSMNRVLEGRENEQ